MKIIFLDVDGVLNYEYCKARVGIYYGVEPENVKLLKKIVDATGAKIILTSSWRREITVGMPLECQENPFAIELMSKLKAEGLKIYDLVSADTNDEHRAEQIKQRLAEYRHDGQQIDGWVVLDNEMFPGYSDYIFSRHLILTNEYEKGLSEEDVQNAITILNGDLDVQIS